MSALAIGLPRGVASAIQLGLTAMAVAATWYAFRYHRSGAARTAVLLAGTFFVSPYMLNYDLLLLMPACSRSTAAARPKASIRWSRWSMPACG